MYFISYLECAKCYVLFGEQHDIEWSKKSHMMLIFTNDFLSMGKNKKDLELYG